MRNLISLTLAFAASILAANSLLAADALKPDLKNSKISFVGSKPDGSKHEGGFKEFKLDVKADFDEPSNSVINIEIKTDSLWSDNPKLTGHLKNPDFFDVRKYPKAVFKSTAVTMSGDGKAVITGKLEMLGKTEEVKIPVTVQHTEEMLKMVGNFKLDRFKWGMTYGEGQINQEVDMAVELTLLR